MRLASLLALLLALAPLAASAQPRLPQIIAVATSSQAANDRLVQEALSDLRLGQDRRVRAAVPEAFAALWPRERYDRYRLSRMQARALVLTAADLAGVGRAGDWRPGDRYDDRRPGDWRPSDRRDDRYDDWRAGDGRPGSRQAQFAQLSNAVYDLADAVPANRFRPFLSGEERTLARRQAQDIRRDALALGCFPLADLAQQLRADAEPVNANRERVVRTIDEMRAALVRCR